jgi:hypothetical protein
MKMISYANYKLKHSDKNGQQIPFKELTPEDKIYWYVQFKIEESYWEPPKPRWIHIRGYAQWPGQSDNQLVTPMVKKPSWSKALAKLLVRDIENNRITKERFEELLQKAYEEAEEDSEFYSDYHS